MEDEILEKIQRYYNFRIEVKFKDFRQYEIYGKIDLEREFCFMYLYDNRYTIEANISNLRNRIDSEIIELFRNKIVYN